jgi:hypothetical protein
VGVETKLDSLLADLEDHGWSPGLTRGSYQRILDSGLRGKNILLACVATEIAMDEHPLTLRGLFYRVVSAGWLPSTDKKHYARMGRVMTKLRESGVVPFHWLVDNLRSSIKPSSWSGIGDFVETVRDAYRKDFWSGLPEYVHIFCEKDAIAGTLSPITEKYDVTLSPIRGYVSLSFAHEIADLWNSIDKPIFAYYLGDHDASGYDLERDLREKMDRYCNKIDWWYHRDPDDPGQEPCEWTKFVFSWRRIAISNQDIDDFDLIPLEPKKSDCRYQHSSKHMAIVVWNSTRSPRPNSDAALKRRLNGTFRKTNGNGCKKWSSSRRNRLKRFFRK